MKRRRDVIRQKVLACIATTACLGLPAQAALFTTLSGDYTTPGGRDVELSGLEWMDWNNSQTNHQTTDQVLAKLLPGQTLEGWRYASRAEFEALFDSVWGGTLGNFHTTNYDGVVWLQENFSLNRGSVAPLIAFGDDGPPQGRKYLGHYAILTSTAQGFFGDDYGLSVGSSAGNSQLDQPSDYNWTSHALVRDAAQVPSPSGMACVAIVLGGFLMRRRRA